MTMQEQEPTSIAEEPERRDTGTHTQHTAETDEQPSVAALQAELASRDERVSGLEENVIQLERELSSTVARYRLALLDAAPDVPGDLVNGETAEALEASLEKARGVVEQVRTRLLEGMGSATQDTEQAGAVIPAGAPPRGANDGTASLSARDKIAQGLERM